MLTSLISDKVFYAIKNISDDENAFIYVVPPQIVGNYQIKLGCVLFDTDDESSSLVINLNNETMCKGLSQKDYQTAIEVGNKNVKVGDVEVNKNGKVKVGEDVNVDKSKGVKISTKKIMSGIQYVGQKE